MKTEIVLTLVKFQKQVKNGRRRFNKISKRLY